MKKYILIPVVIVCVCLLAGISSKRADAAKKEGEVKKQTMCPVSGKPIDKKFFVDYKDSRIYFCCNKCPKEFNKNPEKYMKKLKESGINLEKTPGNKKAVYLLKPGEKMNTNSKK